MRRCPANHYMPDEKIIQTRDGYALGPTRYPATGPEPGCLILAGATAVPQAFYRRFAEYAAAQGYSVTTFDYRGVGRSAPRSLKGFDCDFVTWGRRDLAAVVEAEWSPGRKLRLVAHSFGGHALGLLPNHHLLKGAWMFGTGSGWRGWMPRFEQLRVLMLWNVIGPLLVRRYGYLAWHCLGFGADLPLGVYEQWKCWCRFPRFFLDDPAEGEIMKNFSEVRTSFVAVNASTDRWASPAARNALLSGYTNARWQAIDIDTPGLGHMGYFRPQSAYLWADMLAWVDQLP